jgi:hypothetical protein
VGFPVFADQEVPFDLGPEQDQTRALYAAFDTAIGQEMEAILGRTLPSSRKALILSVLSADRNSLVTGYKEVAVLESTNSTTAKKLSVRISTSVLHKRLQELGVVATIDTPMFYALTFSGVEPSLTKGLGVLQEISGLVPRSLPEEGQSIPELKLSKTDVWMGVLSYQQWQSSHSAQTLDEVWFELWKAYFSRPDLAQAATSNTLQVRISGWLSGQGPMEFDRMLETWSADIGHKSLVGVEMDGPGLSATWSIVPRSREGVLQKLEEAVRFQGLVLEIL